MITVIPIAQTVIDWATLLRIVHAATGRSVTRPLDAKRIEARGTAEAIVALGEFQAEGVDYTSTLRHPGSLLRHFSLSFLAMSQNFDFVAELAFDGDLRILDCDGCDKMFILTASLEQWRTTLINLATPRATKSQRFFAGQVLQAFDKMGLSQLWEDYSRSGGLDLILTEKR